MGPACAGPTLILREGRASSARAGIKPDRGRQPLRRLLEKAVVRVGTGNQGLSRRCRQRRHRAAPGRRGRTGALPRSPRRETGSCLPRPSGARGSRTPSGARPPAGGAVRIPSRRPCGHRCSCRGHLATERVVRPAGAPPGRTVTRAPRGAASRRDARARPATGETPVRGVLVDVPDQWAACTSGRRRTVGDMHFGARVPPDRRAGTGGGSRPGERPGRRARPMPRRETSVSASPDRHHRPLRRATGARWPGSWITRRQGRSSRDRHRRRPQDPELGVRCGRLRRPRAYRRCQGRGLCGCGCTWTRGGSSSAS